MMRTLALAVCLVPPGWAQIFLHDAREVIIVVVNDAADFGVLECAVDAQGLQGAGGDLEQLLYFFCFEPPFCGWRLWMEKGS